MTGSARSTRARSSSTSGWGTCWPSRRRCRRSATGRQQAGPSRTLQGEQARPHRAPLNVKRQRLINRLDLERALAAAPLQRNADILTLPTVTPSPHPGPDSLASGQRHRPIEKVREGHETAQKARLD
ncbi:protein of unknown function (plasmid) [Cupriavidus taiwanensis]|uniref:Uncharacterized protein n=1 Tax=Cupriavidus taiwanensis TaxID=164546 RepID=A0A375HEV9_9BURK|nr:protein of unknown function [Cupriavidus taiwanensis]SOZ72498.1 protein of unknown function [Cupriavidus taiwanensis]SOZ74944.1 protein of unknown function [Cupriavidus taiwanensis]SPA03362.1 protein of unknown function [Cupriavidus taiwanensis]SPA11727.1 protein of unknown function [Cupriavidus taiwanensis]